MATAAARSVFRPASTSARTAAVRISAGAKPNATATATAPARSPFRISTQKPLSHRFFRSPVECIALESMLPYHTATASALLTSMLSVTPRIYSWTFEGS